MPTRVKRIFLGRFGSDGWEELWPRCVWRMKKETHQKKWVDYWMNAIDTNDELVESDKAKLYQGLRQDYATKELRKRGNLFDELGY